MHARKIIRATAMIVAALAALAIDTHALPTHAEPSAQTERKTPDATVSVETALVTDQNGRVLAGLKRENFRVLDNPKAQAITHFEPTSAPITIAMLMEYCGSAYNYFANKAASWGSNFLDHVDPLDWVALVSYDIKPTVKLDFTSNKAEVRQTLNTPSYPQFREANMYDAIIDTLDRLDRVKGKKAILLISTGANTLSAP